MEGIEKVQAEQSTSSQTIFGSTKNRSKKGPSEKKKVPNPNAAVTISKEMGLARSQRKKEIRKMYRKYLKALDKKEELENELSIVSSQIKTFRDNFGTIISSFEKQEDKLTMGLVGLKDKKRKRLDEILVKKEKATLKEEEERELKKIRLDITKEKSQLENVRLYNTGYGDEKEGEGSYYRE